MLINKKINYIYSESVFQISSITADIIAEETLRNPELQKIIKGLQSESKNSPFTIS